MPRARQSGWKLDKSGQYTRQIGWKAGNSGQTKFRLGNDLTKAQLAAQKLAMLWEIVVRDHKRQQELALHNFSSPTEIETRPTWTSEALHIAEAIRRHHNNIRVGMPSNIEGPAAYASYLDYLRQTYGHLIHIQPADMEAAKQGQAQHHHFAQHRSRQARLNARIAQMPIPSGVTGKTLYAALDAYADHAQRATQRESGRVEAATARRLKQSIFDMDLADFGYSALERMKEYWASRPEAKLRNGKGTGRPISLDTVDGHLSVARRFVRWLDRSDDFPWQLPRHGLDALKVNLRRLATDEEVARQRHGVSIFTTEQLATMYKHASDFERLLILLGINAGMAQAEIITTRWDEVEDNPPTIKRIRRKSGVYAEFILWP